MCYNLFYDSPFLQFWKSLVQKQDIFGEGWRGGFDSGLTHKTVKFLKFECSFFFSLPIVCHLLGVFNKTKKKSLSTGKLSLFH